MSARQRLPAGTQLAPFRLPKELVDAIIDHLHAADARSFMSLSLVARAWVSSSRLHLFSIVRPRIGPDNWKQLAGLLRNPLCTILSSIRRVHLVGFYGRQSVIRTNLSWLNKFANKVGQLESVADLRLPFVGLANIATREVSLTIMTKISQVFPRVQCLHLVRLNFTSFSDVSTAISLFAAVDELHIEGVTFGRTGDIPACRPPPRMRRLKLDLRCQAFVDWLTLSSSPIFIDCIMLEIPLMNDTLIRQAARLVYAAFPHLSHIHISVFDGNDLVSLLEQLMAHANLAPQLESLVVHVVSSSGPSYNIRDTIRGVHPFLAHLNHAKMRELSFTFHWALRHRDAVKRVSVVQWSAFDALFQRPNFPCLSVLGISVKGMEDLRLDLLLPLCNERGITLQTRVKEFGV
ncbi:hypothetical protein HGRIS_005324 [Hohenbuehelia grisea]|uniref:F-box domain-containing protein n=1 Tax=Hohenbuehelia grisea TaxID=104357 RepID=A0ABR3JEP6_9AGAR